MTTVTVRGVWSDDVDPGTVDARRVDGFAGEIGQTRVEQDGDAVVGVTGLGPRGLATPARVYRAARAIARRTAQAFPLSGDAEGGAISLVVDLESFAGVLATDEVVAAIVEGASYGGYRFRMTDAGNFVSGSLVVDLPAGAPERPDASDIATAVNHARDLVNLPAAALTPSGFAARARALLEPRGIHVHVRDAAELAASGYGGIVAIGQGSPHPPALLELSTGVGSPELAFVGKGVTYDSGGLSLKSADALMDMKSDMAGAAAVVAAFSLLPALAPGRSFVGVVPLVENMPGPGAIRPGDVVRLREGSTLEILNTDFEGRVILADALARAAELAPRAIVDLASLTYASQHALGDAYAALVATDDPLARRVREAGERSGELVWRMPLQPGLESQIRSEVADYKNFPGAASARVSSAALLLSRFVGGLPWAHIDMSGPAFRHAADAEGAAGGTGFGVRLIAELVRDG